MKKILPIIFLGLLLLPFNNGSVLAQTESQTLYYPGFDKGISGVDFNYRSPQQKIQPMLRRPNLPGE